MWLYKVIGGGHDWPGSYGNMDVNISEEIWKFFNEMSISDNSSINDYIYENKEIIKIIDILGREVNSKSNLPIIYIFNDGSVKKSIIY